MTSSQNINILTDIIEVKDLGFQFSTYANSISKIIKNKENNPPFTIVVNGKWGSGKTHLLKAICNEIKIEEKKDRFLKSIWFNAWKYSKQEDLLASLIQEIFSQIILSEGFSTVGIKLHLKKASDKVELLQATNDLLNILNPGNNFDLTKWIKKTEWENKEPFYKYFDRYLSEILKTIIPSNLEGKASAALVFFIDDLDRCPPSKVVEVLEIINLFFEKNNCIFVLGLDLSYVVHCIDIFYKDYKSDSFSGIEFLQKVINLKFDIPEKSEEDFISYIKSSYPPIFEIFPDVDLLIRAINWNIRNLKQFINSYNLFLNIIPNNLDNKLLFKFLLIQYVDNEILLKIKSEPYLLIFLQEYANNNKIELPDQIKPYISEESLSTQQMSLILDILKVRTNEFRNVELVKCFLQCAISQSNTTSSKEIMVVCQGTLSHNIGETLNFSGTAEPNSTLYISIEKPNNPLTSYRADKLSIISKNNEENTFKKILVSYEGVWDFRWDTQPFVSELELGVYKLHVSNGPYEITNISKKPYDYITFVLTRPKYLQVESSNNVYSKKSSITITGKVGGILPNFLAYWIIKDHFIFHGTFQIDSTDFSYTFDKSITDKLEVGQYFFIIQHPMRNNRFDIDFDNYLGAILSIYPKDGTIIYTKDDYLHKTGGEIAELIIKSINDKNVDDNYTKAQFLIE